MNNTSKVFFAFAKGAESTEGAVIKRYIGIAPCFVLGVNPDKKTMESLYGTTLDKAPEYVGEIEVGEDKHKVANARISFILQPEVEKTGVDCGPMSMAMFLRNEYKFNKDKTKVQVIDKYARTAWVTVEQAKAHEIPVYSNGPAKIDAGYRPAYIGEEELLQFLKTYLNIPNVDVYDRATGTWGVSTSPSDCEASLEKISDYFKGDFSELNSIIALQPKNKVKVLFGVRTTEDGKQYQAFYTQKFMKNGLTDYTKIAAEVLDRKAAGAYSTTEFQTCDFKEYNVVATEFKETANTPFGGDNPFAGSASPASSPWDM